MGRDTGRASVHHAGQLGPGRRPLPFSSHLFSFIVDKPKQLKDPGGYCITEKAQSIHSQTHVTPTFTFHDMTGTEIVRIKGTGRNTREFKPLGEFVTSGPCKPFPFAKRKQADLIIKGG
jgi:hypothetical protein